MTDQPTRCQLSDTLDGRKRWYYQSWLIERVAGAYEAHPAWTRRAHVDKLAGRTLVEVELKIMRLEEQRVREGGSP